MSKKPKQLSTIIIAILGAIMVGAPSQAVPGFIVSSPAATLPAGNYATPVAAVSQDGTLTHYQTELASHDVVSNVKTTDPATWDPRYCPFLTDVLDLWDGWTEERRLEHIEGNPCPLFWSPLIYIGESSQVFIQMADGSPKLEVTPPGSDGYGFYCSIHPWMTGRLIVLPPEG